MKTMAEAEQFCNDNKVKIEGKLAYDPYLGFIDVSPKHENENCIVCDLNIDEDCCPLREECKEDCPVVRR